MKRTALFALIVTLTAPARGDSTIDPAQPFAWGANIGWTNFRPSAVDGVVVGEYVCSGFAWAANVGWINFGGGIAADGIRYSNTSATDFGVNLMPDGTLRGYAWGANVGWINFEAMGNARVSLLTGRLSGYAWGANIGWINLDDMGANFVATTTIAPGFDGDTDGIPDAWELERAGDLATLTATGDADGDGLPDTAEHAADTDPLDPGDALRITAFDSIGGLSTSLTWTSTPTRLYRIEERDDLLAGAWLNVLDTIPPDGALTMRTFSGPPGPRRFFRVAAFRPLAP